MSTIEESKAQVHQHVKECLGVLTEALPKLNIVSDAGLIAYMEEVIYTMQILDELLDEVEDGPIAAMLMSVLSALWSGPMAVTGFLNVLETGLAVHNAQGIVDLFLEQRKEVEDTDAILGSTGGFKQ